MLRAIQAVVLVATSAAASSSARLISRTQSFSPISSQSQSFLSSRNLTIPANSTQAPPPTNTGEVLTSWVPWQSEQASPVISASGSASTVAADSTESPDVVYVTVTVCARSSTSALHLATPSSSASAVSIVPSTGCEPPTIPLTNQEQVGNSTWGTLCQTTFPEWLPGDSSDSNNTPPWGNRTTTNSDATVHLDVPVTNVTRHYKFTISRGRISADGVLRDVILINNQFPAPAIEANWGDMIEVSVHNNITAPVEGTALHWHGMLQRETSWFDGVPAVSQCPIAPGHSFTYTFRAQVYGTSWYHAHYSAQYTGGVSGPMIIYGPSQLPYDIDIGPVMLSDINHIPYFSMVQDVVGTNLSLIPPTSDGVLINGRGRFNCSNPSYSSSSEWLGSNLESDLNWTCVEGAGLSKFRFQPGKTHRLRLINHGADGVQRFSIDGHRLTVIATDYVPTVPYTTEFVTLGVGQRTDVLVTASNYDQQMYWMRAQMPGGIPCGASQNPEALAVIYYEGADTTAEPTTTSTLDEDQSCGNQPLDITQPGYPVIAPQGAYVQDLILTLTLNATGSYEFRVNNQTFKADFNHPSLFLAAAGNVSYPDDPQWNVYNFNQNTSIVLNVTNDTPLTHPFHLHGHTFSVLSVGGRGTVWDGSVVNPTNPMRRDTQLVQAGGYIALAFESNNPGMWSFHCHAAWHLSAGLAINVLTRPQEIPAIPQGMQDQTCSAWWAYTDGVVVDQVDSGS